MKRALRTIGIVAVVVAAAFAYVHLAENKGYALKLGSEAPGFRLPSIAGGDFDFASQRGKVVVLHFWATWCPPCVAELPSLERLYRALGPAGLSVVTVSTDDDEGELRRFLSERSLTLPVLRDAGGRVAWGQFRTTGYPETFVIDREGRLLEHVVGPEEWDSAERIAALRRLLGNAPAR
jgi:cytochrome c biogenesis protein CcmG/thiol:disulfide interchange protein DsbE